MIFTKTAAGNCELSQMNNGAPGRHSVALLKVPFRQKGQKKVLTKGRGSDILPKASSERHLLKKVLKNLKKGVDKEGEK